MDIYVPTTYVPEIKETYFEIYIKQVSCPLAFLFQTPQTPIRIFTVCLQNNLLKFDEKNEKYHPKPLILEMGSSYW